MADFGLAAEPGRAESIAGTPGYIAPEIAVGLRGPSGDVFALAATAWACLFGVAPFGVPPPFGDASVVIGELVKRAIDGEYVAEVRKHKGLPRLLRPVLRSALDSDPNCRPPLEVWLAELAALLESAGWLAALRKRLPAIAVGGVAALLTGLVAASWVASRSEPADPAVAVSLAPGVQHVVRAEEAVVQSDISQANSALYQAYGYADELTAEELERLANAATQIAVTLEKQDQGEDAIIAWMYAVDLYKRCDKTQARAVAWEAMEAAIAREKLKEAPS